jgi:hypothetical protein
VREAYFGTNDPAARRELLDQASGLIQSQIRIIDERMARLAKLREEQQERLDRIRARQEQLAGERWEPAATDGPRAGNDHA